MGRGLAWNTVAHTDSPQRVLEQAEQWLGLGEDNAEVQSKRAWVAQTIVVLLVELGLGGYGMVRLVQDVWAVGSKCCAWRGVSAYGHGHIRRYGDYELQVEAVPPLISEETLTKWFERITEHVAPAVEEEAVLETP